MGKFQLSPANENRRSLISYRPRTALRQKRPFHTHTFRVLNSGQLTVADCWLARSAADTAAHLVQSVHVGCRQIFFDRSVHTSCTRRHRPKRASGNPTRIPYRLSFASETNRTEEDERRQNSMKIGTFGGDTANFHRS